MAMVSATRRLGVWLSAAALIAASPDIESLKRDFDLQPLADKAYEQLAPGGGPVALEYKPSAPGEAHTLVAYESDEPMKVHFKVKSTQPWSSGRRQDLRDTTVADQTAAWRGESRAPLQAVSRDRWLRQAG